MDAQPLKSERLQIWLLALGVFSLVIFFFSPSWFAFDVWSRVPEMGFQVEVRRAGSVLEQVAHPGAPITDSLHAAIQWRLLFPLVGKFLHLSPPLLFALAHLGCLLVLNFLITLLRRAQLSWIDTTLAAVALSTVSWFFTSTGWLGYYDSWLALALLIVGFAQNRWAFWAAFIWAPWVDERFVLAAPLALFCRALAAQEISLAARPPFNLRRNVFIPALLMAGFLLVRLGLLSTHSDSGATLAGYFSGKNFLDAPLSRIVLGVWDGLRSAWLFVFLAVFALRPHPKRAITLAVVSVAVLGIGLATAQDYSRSITMLLPVAVLGVLLAARYLTGSFFHGSLALGAAAGLLLPAHHVMNDRVDPIYYLHHELAAFENPPRSAMPELYELRAIHAMERNEFPQAENYLSLAIALSTNPASPAKQRGILRANQRRWTEAAQDFELLAKSDPQNPDAWFMQAQAHLALGNTSAAHADLARARSLAPPEWTTRPDVARFIAKLNGP